MLRIYLLFLTLVSICSSLNITYPTTGSVFNITKDNTVIWNSTSSDPTLLNINIGNADATFGLQTIGTNVSTSDGKYLVKAGTIFTTGSSYVITINSIGLQGNAFVARSAPFMLVGAGPNITANSTATSSGGASTATSTGAAGKIGLGFDGSLTFVGFVGMVSALLV